MKLQTDMCRGCLVVVALLISFACYSRNSLDNQIKYYFHKEGTLSFKEISDPKRESEFVPLETNTVAYGTQKTALWIRFKMPKSAGALNFIELSNANFGWVSYYYFSDKNGLKVYHTGSRVDFYRRPILVDRFVFPLEEGDDWHYINITTNHAINTQFKIKNQEEVVKGAGNRNLLYLAYMGMILAMTAGVAFYIYMIKYYSYLYYIGYMISLNLLTLIEKGYFFQLLWPHYPILNVSVYLIPFGVSGFMLLFLRGIWNKTRIVNTLFHLNFWVIIFLPGLISTYYFYYQDYETCGRITQIHSMGSGILTIVTSIIALSKTEKSRRMPLILVNLGLCILCAAVLIFLATMHNKLPLNFLTENVLLLGSTLEIIFLTAALVIRSDEIYKTQKARLSLGGDFN